VKLKTQNIFFYHLRKTGGTSLRQLLQRHCDEESTELEVVEGWSLHKERHIASVRNDFSITCLRSPLDRIKSSYKYEGRWEQEAEVRDIDQAKSFETWISEISGAEPNAYLWKCPENYYTKSLIGYPNKGSAYIGEPELLLAMDILRSFNIVLVTELLSSKETAELLNSELGIAEPVPHITFPTKVPTPNEFDDQLFDTPTQDRIFEANELDLRLYEYAKSLYFDKVDSISASI
jgi:hypothetical protein